MGITIRQVSKRFGSFIALEDVSLQIPAGSLTALLGPSGSGKSTLLRVIAGLEQPDSGSIHIFDEDSTRVPPQQREVGFVFQHYAAFKHMTVWDNVAFGLTVRKLPKATIRQRVSDLIQLVQLDGFADRYPAQLSGGQRQRMALARALAIEPRVLLLDEPFGALDARVREDLRMWLRQLQQEVHVTTVLVTHDQEEAMEVADSIVVMNHGRVEQIGTPGGLYDHPASEFVMRFIGHVNRLGETFVRPHDVEIGNDSKQNGSVPAQITRIIYLGFEIRVELRLHDGREVVAQLTRQDADRLGISEQQEVYVLLHRPRVFPDLASNGPAA